MQVHVLEAEAGEGPDGIGAVPASPPWPRDPDAQLGDPRGRLDPHQVAHADRTGLLEPLDRQVDVLRILPRRLDPRVERLLRLGEGHPEAAPDLVVVEELVEGVVGRFGRPEAHEPAGQERRVKLHLRRIEAEEKEKDSRSRRVEPQPDSLVASIAPSMPIRRHPQRPLPVHPYDSPSPSHWAWPR